VPALFAHVKQRRFIFENSVASVRLFLKDTVTVDCTLFKTVVTSVTYNRQLPRPAVSPAKVLEVSECAQIRLLRRILCLGFIAEKPACQPVSDCFTKTLQVTKQIRLGPIGKQSGSNWILRYGALFP
jgi:hypothetical protein